MQIMVSRALGRTIEASGLPTEFRIFHAGVNTTSEGDILLDDVALATVLAAFDRSGVDMMIDLQHDSINANARTHRSDAADARGWCRLAGIGGELWAVNVRWTPDGRARLVAKTQRYISPVVFFDDDRRATEIFNLALVAQPATYGAMPLVAARSADTMNPDLIQKAIDALMAQDADAALEILKSIVSEAAGGEAEAPAEDATAEPQEAPPEETPMSASADVARLTATIRVMRRELDALRLARAADEQEARIKLVGELVKLGAEVPATAWADADDLVPSPSMQSMSLDALRARIAAFAASPRAVVNLKPPKALSEFEGLSDYDRDRARAITDTAARARFVAARLSHGGVRS